MKRQRGRGRKPGGGGGGGGGHYNNHSHHQQPNRTMESNGPDAKVRGPAAHIFERYLQLARDAASAGDRVLSENYMQHADHYFRLVRSMQPAAPPPQAQSNFNSEQEFEGDEDGASMEGGDLAEETDAMAGADGGRQTAEFPQGQEQSFGRDGDPRRRRGRRNRFRPGAGEGEAVETVAADGDGGRTEGAEPREGRRDRPPRERGPEREEEKPEGFSGGPKPAFLRD